MGKIGQDSMPNIPADDRAKSFGSPGSLEFLPKMSRISTLGTGPSRPSGYLMERGPQQKPTMNHGNMVPR